MNGEHILITGANGQLGTALRRKYPNAKSADIGELDITKLNSISDYDWNNIKIIINAAAYTNVDGAETNEGRVAAWKVNAVAVGLLANIAIERDVTLVHVSTEYVFDGTITPHTEDEPFSPLGVYAQSKAAGDIAASINPSHYIIRTSWVIGEGKNFVRTMIDLGKKGINPSVIADDIGRPTFTNELVRAIDHLLSRQAPFGTYNVSNGGDPVSWANLTRAIFEAAHIPSTVTDTTNAQYYSDKEHAAPRPHNSIFSLNKLEATGFKPKDWRDDLKLYIEKELNI